MNIETQLSRVQWVAFYQDKQVIGFPGESSDRFPGKSTFHELDVDALMAFGLRGRLDIDGQEAVLDLRHGIFTINGVNFSIPGDNGSPRRLIFSFTRSLDFNPKVPVVREGVARFNLGYEQAGKLFVISLI